MPNYKIFIVSLIFLALNTLVFSEKVLKFDLKKRNIQNKNTNLLQQNVKINDNKQQFRNLQVTEGFEENEETLENVENQDSQQNQDIKKDILNIKDAKTLLLNNILGIHYDAELFIGSDKQPFKIIIDTGSTMMWISDTKCESCLDMGVTNRFDCEKSQTCNYIPEFSKDGFEIEYGHGYVAGQLANETVYFDQNEQSEGVVMPLLLISDMEDLQYLASDGIIGLGRQKGSELNVSVLQILKQQNFIDKRLFSLYLAGQQCVKNSILTIGGYDASVINGGINYIETIRDDLWAIQISEIQLNSKQQIQSVNTQARIGVIDSGTTKITFPTEDIQAIIKQIKQKYHIKCIVRTNFQGMKEVLCEREIKDSNIELIFVAENVQFKLSFSYLVDQCFPSITGIIGRVCTLHIQVVDLDNEKVIILGEIFMQKYVTIFDEENERIGFGTIDENLLQQQQSDGFVIIQKHLDIVFFQVGIICVIAISTVLISNMYYKYVQKFEEKVLESSDNNNSANNTAPQGVTIDMSGNGIESFDEGDLSQQEEIVSQQNQQDNQESIGQINQGGAIKSTDR